jgi:hypothetical protein
MIFNGSIKSLQQDFNLVYQSSRKSSGLPWHQLVSLNVGMENSQIPFCINASHRAVCQGQFCDQPIVPHRNTIQGFVWDGFLSITR